MTLITWSQTAATNATADATINWAEGQAPSTVNNSARAMMAAVAKYRDDVSGTTITTAGSSDAYTVTTSQSLTALTDGFEVSFIVDRNNTGAATLAVDGLTAKALEIVVGTGLAADTLVANTVRSAVYDAGNDTWLIKDVSGAITAAATTTGVLTGTATDTAVTPDALAALWEQGSDIASSGTISIGEGGHFHVTGTTTITDIDFGTDKAGRAAMLVFDGALTLTHNATTLILPGGANITTAAGDVGIFVSEGSDNVRCVVYQPASIGAVSTQAQAEAGTATNVQMTPERTSQAITALQTAAATQAEQETGTSTTVYVSPGRQHFHPGHPKCWGMATVSGGTPTLQTSYNITSITDNGSGDITFTIATDFSSANWACLATVDKSTAVRVQLLAQTAGTVRLSCNNSGGTSTDPDAWHMMGLGDQA